MARTFLFIVCLLLSAGAFAQNRPGYQEISIGQGVLTSEQMFDGTQIGILEPTMRKYTNINKTGIFFANYKYYLSKKVSVGFTAGIEQESGDWNYNNMSGKPDDWETFKIGSFSRTAYTIAPELTCAYLNRKNVCLYSTLGVGATFKTETDIYDTSGYSNGKAYYRGGSLSQNNNLCHFNAYFSPIGVSVNAGNHFSFFSELGIGYKGIFNLGFSYRLNTIIPALRSIPVPARNPVILLPANYPDDSSLVFIENIKERKARRTRNKISLATQLDKASADASNDGGNVFRITHVEANDMETKVLKGKAYYSSNYDSFKIHVAHWKNKAVEEKPHAYIVIYRNTEKLGTAKLKINDSEISIAPYSKYILKITKEGLYTISTSKNTVTIDAKPGNYYYFKAFHNRKGSGVSVIDNTSGALESSLINKLIK